jgi:hypothetical protein
VDLIAESMCVNSKAVVNQEVISHFVFPLSLPFIHSFTHSLTHSLTHSFIHSLTHSLSFSHFLTIALSLTFLLNMHTQWTCTDMNSVFRKENHSSLSVTKLNVRWSCSQRNSDMTISKFVLKQRVPSKLCMNLSHIHSHSLTLLFSSYVLFEYESHLLICLWLSVTTSRPHANVCRLF